MDGFSKTTGKLYDKHTYQCTACGIIYHESDDCRCPACGSDQRKEHQQTVASLAEEGKQAAAESGEAPKAPAGEK